MNTRKKTFLAAATATFALTAPQAGAVTKVGGADMFADKNIMENAVNSPIHKTLVAAVKAAGLVETLSGEGPFTVFAPTDFAFDALPDGTVENLLKPENKNQLARILSCHVVATAAMYYAIRKMIEDDSGTHQIETLGGCVLQGKMNGNRLTLTDENGTLARVLVPDVVQSNGIIHVIDGVILPASDNSSMDEEMSDETAMDGDKDTSEEMAMESAMEKDMGDGMSENDPMDEDSAMEADADEDSPEEVAMEEDMGQGDMDNHMTEDVGQDDSGDAGIDSDESAMSEENANPTVGGAPMFADKTIVDNAVNSPVHTILVDAVIAADLAGTLSGEGPFTVFAPVDSAFGALPSGTVDTLLMAGNVDQLTKILTCHVVAADVMSAALFDMIQADGGSHPLETVGGCTLLASVEDGVIKITDEQGGVANVTVADVDQSNGVIHVIDRVLLPAM